MASITTRAGKGTPLSNAEVDSNFTNLNDELGTKLPLSGGTLTGALNVSRRRLSFSSSYNDSNHSIYNNYENIDGEGIWDGMKMNVFAGLMIRTGNASGATPTTVFSALDGHGVQVPGSFTMGSRSNSANFGGNTSGMSGHAFPAEIRANGAKPTLTWHYEGVATRHIALDSDGALNVYNPGESGGAVFKVGGDVALHAGNYNSYAPTLTGTGASGTWGISISGNAATAGGLYPSQFFNNMGSGHSTYTDFNTAMSSGANYMQGGTNGPTGATGHQFYGFKLGLGSDYDPATQYASQLYWARQNQGGGEYLWARDMESGSWGSWRKMAAGYADNAGLLDSLDSSDFARAVPRQSGADLNNFLTAGSYGVNYDNYNKPGDWGGVLVAKSADVIAQWYGDHENNFWVRGGNPPNAGGGGVWNSWQKLLHSGNYNSYALPLSGGTLSGELTLGGNNTWFGGSTYLRSNTTFSFLTNNGGAQNGRFNGIQVSDSYAGSVPTNGILFGTDTTLVRDVAYELSLSGNRVHHDGNAPRARNSDLMYYAGFTLNADSMPTNSTGFSYSNGAPFTGPIIKIGTGGGYDMQFSASYGNSSDLAFRTRQGDGGYWNGWRRVFLEDAWQSNKYFGSDGAIYGTIFYDTNNGAYFCDPSGRSRLSSMDYGDGGYYFAGGDWGYRHNTPYGWIQFGPANSGHAHIYTDRSNFYFNVETSASIAYGRDSSRAPIFYDSNDTTYYVDPAGNGTRAAYLNGNLWINPKPESYGEGVTFYMPSQSTWGGLRWYRNGPGGGYSGNWAFGYFGNEANNDIGFHNGTNGWRLDHSFHNTVVGSVRSPIFYDSNDTGYYCDPNSTSRFNRLRVGDGSSSWIDMLDDESPNGVKYLHANSNYLGFVSGYGGWVFRCDNGGNTIAEGNVTAYSDERLKTDWAPLAADFVDRLAEAKSGTYTRISNGKRQAGSSAQDWLVLLPEVVEETNDEAKTLALAYGNAALVSAIELAKRVVAQEARIAQLEATIQTLIGDRK